MAFCCQPTLGSWGSGSSVKTTSWLFASSVQLGGSNPASVKDWAHLLTASKQRTGLSTSPETVVSATAGCLWRTIFRQSAQLAQWAPSLILAALVSPEPPWKNGNEAVTSALPSMGIQKQSETFPHVCIVGFSESRVHSGWTPLNQKLALVDAHMSRATKPPVAPPQRGCVGRECGARLTSPRETAERTQVDPLGSPRS